MLKSDLLEQLRIMSQQNLNLIYKDIATWMLNNFNTIDQWTIVNISKKVNCSNGMIIKFSKKLGFKGFKNLHFQLRFFNNFNESIISKNINIFEEKNEQKFYDDYYFLINNSLEFTYQINREIIFEVLSLFDLKVPIYLFGKGANLMIVQTLGSYLLKLNYSVNYNIDFDGQLSFLSTIKKNDLAIIFTYSGTTYEIQKIFFELEKKEAKILLITSNNLTDLFQKTQYKLLVKHNEEVLKNLRHSRIQFIYLVMSLILLLSFKNNEKYIN